MRKDVTHVLLHEALSRNAADRSELYRFGTWLKPHASVRFSVPESRFLSPDSMFPMTTAVVVRVPGLQGFTRLPDSPRGSW